MRLKFRAKIVPKVISNANANAKVDPVEAGWSGPTKHVKPTAETTISLSQIQVKHGGGGREDEDGGDGGDGSGGEDEDGDDSGDGGDVVVVKKKLVMMVVMVVVVVKMKMVKT